MLRSFLVVGLALAGARISAGEEIRVLSAGSLQRGLASIAETYKAETGHTVIIEVGTTPVMTQRLEAGEVFDIVIGTRAVIEAAAARGQVDASTAPVVGRVGIGIGVRSGVEVPDARTVQDLESLLLSADTIVYNRGSSGVYSRSMIESMGLAGRTAGKTTQYANAGQVVAHVLDGRGRDLGLAPLTELQASVPSGLRVIPLPDAVQNYTAYSAAVASDAVAPAADFVRYLTTEAARRVFGATGVD